LRIVTVPLVVVVIACFGLTACITVQDRMETAKAGVRATKPLGEWVDVRPEHLAEVDPERLRGEGVALVVIRSLQETATGEKNGLSDTMILRNVSTSTVRAGPLHKIGTEAEVGWGVLIVPPGQYALNRSTTTTTTSLRQGAVTQKSVDTKGHPFVPLDATLHIGTGDVVYLGTVVWVAGAAGGQKTPKMRDERAAAAAWMQANLPAFAPRMQTKLLPKSVQPLS
jgi:hypothetical protein